MTDASNFLDSPDEGAPAPATAAAFLDAGTQKPQADYRSDGENVFRQLGLTSRDIFSGLAGAATVPGDLANMAINKVSPTINKYTGSNIPPLGMPTEDVKNLLTKAGLPLPENNKEKLINGAAETMVQFMPNAENLIKYGKEAANNLGDMWNGYDGPATSAEAKTIANSHYQTAQESGGILTPNFTDKFLDKVSDMTPQTSAGKVVAGDTPLTQLNQRLQALRGKPLTLPAIQEVDEHLGNLIDSEHGPLGLSKNGQQLATVQRTLRNMVSDAGESDIVGGTDGFDALQSGRKAYSQAMKMQDVEKIARRASLSENPSTAIRTGIRTYLGNQSNTRGWSLDEVSALQDSAKRGAIGGTLNLMGSKLIPIGAGLIAEHTGGPIGAAVAFGASHAWTEMARKGATAIQDSKLQNVLQKLGGNVPQ